MSKTSELKKAAGEVYSEKKTSIINVAKGFTPTNIFLGGVGLLAAWFAFREFKKMFSTSPEQQVIEDIEEAIDYEQQQGNQLSYPIAQYTIWANIIEEATDTSGTDEEAIYNVFEQLGNNTDLLQLIKAYGERMNFVMGIPLGYYTLPQILTSELSNSEKANIQNILDSKFITITVF